MRTLSPDTQVEATREGAVSSTPTASALSPDVMQVGRIEMSPDTEVGRLEKGAVFSGTRTEQKHHSPATHYASQGPCSADAPRDSRSQRVVSWYASRSDSRARSNDVAIISSRTRRTHMYTHWACTHARVHLHASTSSQAHFDYISTIGFIQNKGNQTRTHGK